MSLDDASTFGMKDDDYRTIVRLLEQNLIDAAAKYYAGVMACEFKRAKANVSAIKILLDSKRDGRCSNRQTDSLHGSGPQ